MCITAPELITHLINNRIAQGSTDLILGLNINHDLLKISGSVDQLLSRSVVLIHSQHVV